MNDYLARFRVPIDKIPEARNWKVGGKYTLHADVEQVGIAKERDYSTGIDKPMLAGERRKSEKPKYRTMVEFKINSVCAPHKSNAIKSRYK